MTQMMTPSYNEDDDVGNERSVNLPHEREEIKLKKTIFRFLKDNVDFEGRPELVEEKIRELTVGLYEITLSWKDK